MDASTLDFLKEWFARYCSRYYSAVEEDQRNILLKEEHTHNVCADIVRLAEEEKLGENMVRTAEAVALFHDVGRFEQYRRYRTFRDSESVNHALLGAQVLVESGVLESLPECETRIILQAVRFHNVFQVPIDVDMEALVFVRLIRDADKLDIWRVFIELFHAPEEERASAAALGFPDTGEYTADLLQSLYRKEMIALSRLKTLNDFRLLQLSWVFDINYAFSLRLLRERSCIGRIAATLPDEPQIRQVVDFLIEHVEERLHLYYPQQVTCTI